MLAASLPSELTAFLQPVTENPHVQRLAIILAYALLAKLADLFVDRLLKRLASRTRITADDKIIGILHIPICYTILLFGFRHSM